MVVPDRIIEVIQGEKAAVTPLHLGGAAGGRNRLKMGSFGPHSQLSFLLGGPPMI